MKVIKKLAVLIAPLLLFAVMLVPYGWTNRDIVEWLGCEGLIIDNFGNLVENNFSAKDFTVLFWLFISICVTGVSVFLSKRIPREKIWLRILYITGMLLISLLISHQISYQFCQMMLAC